MSDEQKPSPRAIAAAFQAHDLLRIERLGDVREAVTALNDALRRAAGVGLHIPELKTEIFPPSTWNKELGHEVLQVVQPEAFRGYKE